MLTLNSTATQEHKYPVTSTMMELELLNCFERTLNFYFIIFQY